VGGHLLSRQPGGWALVTARWVGPCCLDSQMDGGHLLELGGQALVPGQVGESALAMGFDNDGHKP